MPKTTMILLGVLILLGGVYVFFFWNPSPEAPLTSTPAVDPSEQQFIDLASRLDAISFDTSIFDDPRFDLLVSLATPITPETLGRNDPFAPIGR